MRSLFRFTLLCFLFSLFSCDVTDSNNTEDKSKVEKLTESTLTLTNGQEATVTVSLVANTFYNLVIPGQRETSQLEIAVTAPSGSVQYITFDPFFQAKESGVYTIKFTWTGTEELSTTVTINSVAIPTEIYGTWFLTKEKETEAGAVISETSFSTVAESNFIIVNTPLYCFEYELEGDTIIVDTALFEEWGSDLLYMSIQNGALVYDESGNDEGISWSRYESYKPYSGQLPPQEWLDKISGDDNDDTPALKVTTTIIDSQTVNIPASASTDVSFTISKGQTVSVVTKDDEGWIFEVIDPSGNSIEFPFGIGFIAEKSGTYTIKIMNGDVSTLSTVVYLYQVKVPQSMHGSWYLVKEYEKEEGEEFTDIYDTPDESSEINIFTQSSVTVLTQPADKSITPIGSYWGIGCPVYGDEIKTFFRGDTLVICEKDFYEGEEYIFEVSFLPYSGGDTFPDGWSGRTQRARKAGNKRKRR